MNLIQNLRRIQVNRANNLDNSTPLDNTNMVYLQSQGQTLTARFAFLNLHGKYVKIQVNT